MTQSDSRADEIMGVDREVLEKFLELIRDRYTTATSANYYIEHQVGISGTTVGITNIRDVLSHMVTLLGSERGRKPLSIEDQKAQVHNAAEHIRRAIYEPYELAAKERLVRLGKVIAKYEKIVIKRGNKYLTDNAYPDRAALSARKESINLLMGGGRYAKSTNVWDTEWEEAVKELVKVNEAIENFKDNLEDHITEAEADVGISLGKWGIITGVILFIVGTVVTWLIAKHFG